jgi:tRNA pseudouridine13 synthase
VGVGVLRRYPEDFQVEEDLGFSPAGTGHHLLLRVRKRDANTQWVARELARACPCRPFDVGYAGLKDRHAVAVQWFTVPRSGRSPESWVCLQGEGFEVLEAHVHTRKLPRGALAGNRFAIRIRDVSLSEEALTERAQRIARLGIPNYFGPQRFGRAGANLQRIQTPLRELQPAERGFVLSAARSLIFNAVLGARVADGTWARVEAGDLAGLDGRASFFEVTTMDAVLAERCERLDIHPTGPMWGGGEPRTHGRIAELERNVATALAPAAQLAVAAGLTQERRSLRVAVRDLQCSREGGDLWLRFRVGRGSFATSVLRELFRFDAQGGTPPEE